MYDVTNFIELPVFFVVHVILEKNQCTYLFLLFSVMFTKHDYVIADPHIQLLIGQKMTQHVTGEIFLVMRRWGIPSMGNTARKAEVEVEVCLLKNYGKTTVVIYYICHTNIHRSIYRQHWAGADGTQRSPRFLTCWRGVCCQSPHPP